MADGAQSEAGTNADATTNAETATEDGGAVPNSATEEEKKDSDGDSYDSDYDEEGRYIWGDEGDDWEFYYKEDKEAYEAGLSTVPECLNPGALPREVTVETTTAASGTSHLIGVSMARDGAVYRT